MKKLNGSSFITFTITAGCSFVAFNVLRRDKQQSPPTLVSNVTTHEVLVKCRHLRKDTNNINNFTIIEFFDYECPPCKLQNITLQAVLKKYKNIQYDVFHFPLNFHKNALPAAIAAEKSDSVESFWRIHEVLMSMQQLKQEYIKNIYEKYVHANSILSEKQVAAIIKSDYEFAKKLKISGTPTFFLCHPNNKVWKLNSLLQIEGFLK